MPARPRRSCLAVPASNPGMLAKAATLEADEVVVDLEDGVAVEHKEAARSNLAAARAPGTLAVRAHDDALSSSAERALALGYDGKWVIHPIRSRR